MFFRYVKHACNRQTDKQTDKQTDGRTDGQNYDPQDRASIAASRSKNEQLHDVCYNTAYDACVQPTFSRKHGRSGNLSMRTN